MRVLLVEDDEMIGLSLRAALAANGWSVDWVKDGQLAQSALADGDYAFDPNVTDLQVDDEEAEDLMRTLQNELRRRERLVAVLG